MQCKHNKNSGFTLVEAMLAASVLFVGIMVVMSSLSTSFDINLLTEEQGEVITVITHEVERIKSKPLCDDPSTTDTEGTLTVPEPGTICHDFVYDDSTKQFTQVINFPIDYFRDENDQPIQGHISAVLPDPPLDPNLLIEFNIEIEYPSDIRGPVYEGTTVWVSPQY